MTGLVSNEIEAYVDAHSHDESETLKALETETRATMELHQMLVGRVEGGFLRLLTRVSGARRVLEIGTFTGYSALSIAEGLPHDGRVTTCDINEQTTALAKQYWAKNPHGAKIELRLGPALETIKTFDEHFDMVFIDADKENYINYWEACVPIVRSGGLLLADNVLWSGRVLNPSNDTDRAVDQFNKHVLADKRVDAVMLSIRDGITMARKH